jgi:AAA ATPase containing von Willebrand factor type A (vWA) domain
MKGEITFMRDFIKNSKGQFINVEHLREAAIVKNDYTERYEIIGYYGNSDEVFIDDFDTEEEAENALREILGEIKTITPEPKVLAPDPETEERFGKIFGQEEEEDAGPGVRDEDIPDAVIEAINSEPITDTLVEENSEETGEIPLDEIMKDIAEESKESEDDDESSEDGEEEKGEEEDGE